MTSRRAANHMRGGAPLLVAIALAIATLAVESYLLHLPLLGYFRYSAWADGPLLVAIHVAGVLAIAAAQALFFWSAFVSPRRWQAVYVVLFAAAAFVQFGYAGALGALMNAHDVDVALENTKYWSAMAGAFWNWWAAAPCALFLVALAFSRPRPGRPGWRLAGALALSVAIHSSYAAHGLLRGAQDVGMSNAAPVPTGTFQGLSRALTMFAWNRVAGLFDYHLRDRVTYQAAAAPARHIVLVIDESISAGHLSLDGYGRPTTPWLEELAARGKITNWGIASSATNNSNGSVLSILTGVQEIPDTRRQSLTAATLFQYAKAMRFRTHLLDSQIKDRRFGISWADIEYVDDFRSAEAFGEDCDADFRVGREVQRLVQEPEGQFIVVLKRGNHFPHGRNYPSGHGTWVPSTDTDVPAGTDPDTVLTNTYDNGIRYNIDGFFHALLRPDGSLPRTTVLYTSDHGEVVGHEGTRPLARTLAWGLMAVPLLMAGDDRPAVDTEYRASHHNLFATMLDLMGVPESARIGTHRRSLLTARASDHDPRVVFGGFMFDAAASERRDLDGIPRPAALGQHR